MKQRFPGVLWLLPICFGFFGGIVAGLIASLKYQASWWELVLAGLLINIAILVMIFVMPTMI